jgi:hypothetical protein
MSLFFIYILFLHLSCFLFWGAFFNGMGVFLICDRFSSDLLLPLVRNASVIGVFQICNVFVSGFLWVFGIWAFVQPGVLWRIAFLALWRRPFCCVGVASMCGGMPELLRKLCVFWLHRFGLGGIWLRSLH